MIIAIRGDSPEGLEKVKDILINNHLFLEIQDLSEAERLYYNYVIEGIFRLPSIFNWYVSSTAPTTWPDNSSTWVNFETNGLEDVVSDAVDSCYRKNRELLR